MTRSSAACNDTALTALVHKHIPHASLLSSAGGELSFQLPLSNKGAFAQLFQELEQKKEELHIGGYGVSMKKLEEVFLRLASDSVTTPDEESSAHFVNEPASHKVQHENQGGKNFKRDVVIPVSSSSLQSSSFTRAYGQMLLKRVLIARRDWKGLANSVLLPVLAISLVMLILKLNINPAGPSLQLDFRMFKQADGRSIIPVTKASHNDISIFHANDHVKFQARDCINNSVAMSEKLLHAYSTPPTTFGALVFYDTLWPELNTSNLWKLNVTQVGGLFNISRDTSNTSAWNETYRELFRSPSRQGISSPVTFLFNTTSDHALLALIQELMQAKLKANLGNESAILKVASHPLPLSKTEFMELQTVLAVLAALFVLIPFCYLGASYAVFVVKERVVKAKLLQLTNEDASSGKIVLIEDSDSDSYVAIGEVMASDYTPERVGSASWEGGHQIRVMLKTVTKPGIVLPFKIHDDEGRVLCRTLGEAFLKKKGVMWLISDTILTQQDWCTVRTWA